MPRSGILAQHRGIGRARHPGAPRFFLTLWEVASGSIQARAEVPLPRSLGFAPGGATLVVAGNGSWLALLDPRTLEVRTRFVGHAGEVFSAQFSPDGTRVLSGGRDGLLRVWDSLSGDLLGEFAGHRDYIWCVAMSPDGARVVTGSGDFDVRVWESEPASVTERRRRDALAQAGRAAPRVAALLAELGSPAAVAERLRSDPALSDAERRAALDELLRAACAGP